MSSNETVEDLTESIEPSAAHKTVTIGQGDFSRTYTQKPLSFFQKLEVFGLLGETLDKSMSGPDGLTLAELLDGPGSVGSTLSDQNFTDADTFVKAIARLVQYAPDLLANLYLIVLNVPRGERFLIRDLMELPEDEGGLSDEDGFGILETFVDQNWTVMVDFFNSRVVPLFNKVTQKVQESQPSKPSKNTRQTTPKASKN